MGSAPVRQEMTRVRQLAGASGSYVYNAAVSAARPPAGYTARVIPHCDGVAIPLEDARILWQRWSDRRRKRVKCCMCKRKVRRNSVPLD